jgi:Flp pilus assembly protein TadB
MLKLGGAAVAILLLGVLGIVIFGNIWARIGIGAAVVLVGGILIFFAWRTDRREKELRAGLDELPRV